MPLANQAIPVAIQLWDGSEDKFVRAIIRGPDGEQIDDSPVYPEHIDGGFYTIQEPAAMPPGVEFVTVFYQVFDDEGYLIPSSSHEVASETFELQATPQATTQQALPPDISATISDEVLRLEAVVREAEEIAAVAALDPVAVQGEVTGELVLVAKVEQVDTELEGGA